MEKVLVKNNYTIFIIFNNIKMIKLGVIMSSYPKNLFLGAVSTYLIKHHQKSRAELLHPEVSEQSNSRVE
jgi:hypothetical protein